MNSNQSSILKAAAIIGIPVLLLFAYQYSPFVIRTNSWEVKKMNQNTEIESSTKSKKKESAFSKKVSKEEKKKIIEGILNTPFDMPRDTSKRLAHIRPNHTFGAEKENNISQRILLLGDSETGGLIYPLNDYCVANGHKLDAVFTWFSASILNFGYSNKVDELIEKYKPTFVIFVVGLNEMYVTDMDRRSEAAQLFLEKLGDTPYLWVGPANFTTDKGINKVFESTAAPGCFLLSKDLDIPRGGDHRHPNVEGYKIWMDYIANYIQGNSAYPFNFLPPEHEHVKLEGRVILANAAKDKGY